MTTIIVIIIITITITSMIVIIEIHVSAGVPRSPPALELSASSGWTDVMVFSSFLSLIVASGRGNGRAFLIKL